MTAEQIRRWSIGGVVVAVVVVIACCAGPPGRFPRQVFNLGLRRGIEDARTRLVYADSAGPLWRMEPKDLPQNPTDMADLQDVAIIRQVVSAPPGRVRFYMRVFLGGYWCAWTYGTYALPILVGCLVVGLVFALRARSRPRRRAASIGSQG